jgi:integrase
MPLWKDPKTRRWRYQFQHLGQRHSKTGFKTKAEARANMEGARKELREPPALIPAATVFKSVANDYLDYAKRRYVVKTYKQKVFVYKSFMEFVGDRPLDRITTPLVESYLSTRSSNNNWNKHRKDLCALFAWAWRRGLMAHNPCQLIDKMPMEAHRKLIPTEDEMARLLVAAGPDRPLVQILLHTMARIDEILRLKWEDVNLSEASIRLWTRKRKDGSWAFDMLPLNPTALKILHYLWEKREHPEWVFPNPRSGDRYYHRPKLMRSLCRKAGVRHFGFHAIRHFAASYLADKAKESMPTISRLLRHRRISTTEIYLQKVDDNLRGALEGLEAVGEGNLLTTYSPTYSPEENGVKPKSLTP